MKKLLALVAVGLAFQAQAMDPSSLRVKVYKVAFSTSVDCTNLQTVYEGSASDATFVDFLNNPVIAENASLADGTYKCVAIEMSDLIKFTPTTSSGACVADQEETLDVCRGSDGGTYELIDGTQGTCDNTYGTDDRVTLWLSQGSTATGGGGGANGFTRPTSDSDSANGFNLSSPFVKSGAATGIFYVDGTGQVTGGGSCDMQPPAFGFR